ncbi:hypothetical protein SDC9_64176 [bioreactor metagenome]|uniref:Uncharacterized protein n=1 Tax=bioreactor metagenome TaxID=1076179 RepID=A0A644XP76_9ZZZZ
MEAVISCFLHATILTRLYQLPDLVGGAKTDVETPPAVIFNILPVEYHADICRCFVRRGRQVGREGRCLCEADSQRQCGKP